jgi:tetratricopeptide (TPR) repeat protein
MSGIVRHYYAGGNTATGFYSLYDSVLDGLNRLFILKGGPGTGKSSLMKDIGARFEEKGLEVEYLHCASDNQSIDGVILPQSGIGIVDGTAPHIIEPKAPGVIEEYVNLGAAWNSDKLAKQKEEILDLNVQITRKFQDAYETFDKALKAHDDIEEIYISNMDFTEANQLTEELISTFYQESSLDKEAKVVHRFLGAATPNGAVDYIQNLTQDVKKRYFIKGRAGSGKSTMLKKIAAAGEEKGFDVEIYHCGFDPNSLDMVIIREQGIAIFDSTAPHEYFPDRESDEIIDMYERCITPGTDEKFEEDIARTTMAYKDKMKEAISYLSEAKELRESLEAIYIESMDFEKVNKLKEEIYSELISIVEAN